MKQNTEPSAQEIAARISLEGPVAGMIIWCDDHPRKSRVATFTKATEQSDWRRWSESRRTDSSAQATTTTRLSGVKPLPKGTYPDELHEPVRVKYEMKCKLCRVKVDVRHEKLSSAFDKLRHAGASELSLRLLAAIM